MRVVHPDRIQEAGWCEPTNFEGDSRMNVHKNARTAPRSRAVDEKNGFHGSRQMSTKVGMRPPTTPVPMNVLNGP
jgi:hypothetical protein